jgi:hypothetical protein
MRVMLYHLRAALFAIIGLLSCTAAMAGDMLADRHSVRGVGCAECHGKSAPQNAMTSAACAACHGTLTEMAAQRATAGGNPHVVGAGTPDCIDCHHGHRP